VESVALKLKGSNSHDRVSLRGWPVLSERAALNGEERLIVD